MEERVKTSFIPKTSLQAPETRQRANPVALANIICGALLILAILGAGGVYLFEKYTGGQISSKADSLARSREAFEPSTIQELSRLNTRIETGKVLLSEHITVSKLFDELEKLTLSSLRYSDFEYSIAAPGHVVLTMRGEASSFNAVALQSEAFGKSFIITEPIFSNVNVGKNGVITFDFTGVIDTSRILYEGGAPATPVQPAPTQTP
ncbi:hypothetical protein HY090_02265 [Candidatus Kaiserbacteria bacterium]|nr:hypothetical protein [Candidatus Kaiserbacteria bacterium]